MSYLDRLLYPTTYCENATAHLLSSLDVKYTRSYLQKELKGHPDYPSLLSIADVIGASYNVPCIPLQYSCAQILAEGEIRPPFIAHLTDGEKRQAFAVVTRFSNEAVEMYNSAKRKKETLSPAEFNDIYLGTILIARAEANSGEKGFEKNYKEERKRSLFQYLGALTLPVLTIIACLVYLLPAATTGSVLPIVFTLLTLAGAVLGTLLLWHEVDEYNPVIMQMCQTSRKVNCTSVLHSNASKIFGLSWSRIGFSYFTGMLVVLISGGLGNPVTLLLLGWINILALPYIAFSVYYQWRVAKQWCVLCLMVQSVLFLQFIVAFIGGFHTFLSFAQIPLQAYLATGGIFVLVFMTTMLIMSSQERAKEGRQKKFELLRLKNNPKIFATLLSSQKAIEKPADNLGITLGNPDGVFRLIKVCNPYCGPCANVHPDVEHLVENNEELGVQVIFAASEDDADMKKIPVSHFLAIDTKKDKQLTKKALDDWYSDPSKDYSRFAARYPLNGELKEQEGKVKEMREWCEKTDVTLTPTFFLCLNTANNKSKFYQLPQSYTVSDLKYFLTV